MVDDDVGLLLGECAEDEPLEMFTAGMHDRLSMKTDFEIPWAGAELLAHYYLTGAPHDF